MVSTVHVNSDTQASSQVRGHKPSSMWRSLLTSLAGLSIFPNPFNPRTAITFTIDHAQNVKLSIFDMTGKCIYVLANREFQAGAHSMDWQGRDWQGHAVSTGCYLVRMNNEEKVTTEKMMLIMENNGSWWPNLPPIFHPLLVQPSAISHHPEGFSNSVQ